MLKVHFINVGKGNCTIIEFPSGNLTVIDTDNSRNNDNNDLTDPVDFINKHYPNRSIFRLIITHPDMDHLSGMEEIDNNFSVINFWDTDNNKVLSDKELDESIYDKEDWKTYQKYRKSESDPKCLFLYRNSKGDYWNEDGIKILSPSKSLVKKANETGEYNHLSYVLSIKYNGYKILLGGDATVTAWNDIRDNIGDEDLKADLFLAPHHGSTHNVNKEVFKDIDPDHVVISVVRKVDYDYDYYSGLANKKVLTTKYYGTISFHISHQGKIEHIYVQKNAGE